MLTSRFVADELVLTQPTGHPLWLQTKQPPRSAWLRRQAYLVLILVRASRRPLVECVREVFAGAMPTTTLDPERQGSHLMSSSGTGGGVVACRRLYGGSAGRSCSGGMK